MNKPILIKSSKIISDLKSALNCEYNQVRDDGIHVSDLNLCLREVVFRKVDPQAITEREIGFFTVGRAIHDSIQTLAKIFPNYQVEKEINYEIDGITIKAHIDLYDKKQNIPIEVKTVRKKRLVENGPEEPKPFNTEQLKMYMTLTDADKGFIVYQLLLDYSDSPFRVFEITMSKEERQEMLENMVTDAFHLQMNLDNKTPENTKHVFNNPDKSWKCSYCKYSESCQQMRSEEWLRNKNK
jgi:CRISPR/Cas system-associated exonuclease Cas4 (RecB family)